MAVQIAGNVNSTTLVEVETNTKAARMVIRPDDYGSLGIYKLGLTNGATAMAAGLAANAPIFSFRNGGTNLAIVKRVLLSMYSGGTGFTAGSGVFQLFVARSFTASDTGGTASLPSGNGSKLRTTMGATTMTDIRISATAALTAGTRTLDTTALSSISVGVSTGTWTQFVPTNTPLIDQRIGEFPLVLAQNEGFVIEANLPATGVWFFSVNTDWEELASY
jgi:hypothetical protein